MQKFRKIYFQLLIQSLAPIVEWEVNRFSAFILII